jgi:hypothetical protein
MCARLVALPLLAGILITGGPGVAAASGPPLADAGLDQTVTRGSTVLLDAAGSRDPDGTIQSYRWSIETPDGRTIRPADPNAARTTFVARTTGRYEVTVTVTGDGGRSATDTLYVDVEGAERSTTTPDDTGSAEPTPSDGGSPGETTPADPDPGVSAPVSPEADGVTEPATPDAPLSTSGGTTSRTGDGAFGTGPTHEHTGPDCRANATRTTEFGCLDGEYSAADLDIKGDLYVRQGSVHSYRAVVDDRPSGNERLTWAGGLGRGTTVTKVFTEPVGSTVVISATVHDGEGHTTTDRLEVQVVTGNQPPGVRIEGPVAACVGDPVELEGYATASEDHDEVVEATWHGDPTFVPQHPGEYEVAFSARDKQAQTARTSHTVTVRDERICDVEAAEQPTRIGAPAFADKLIIRASDDNWSERSGSMILMRAKGDVPTSDHLEQLADLGAVAGKAGEATIEFAIGNKETKTITMSAENASRLQRIVERRPSDDVPPNGPRINEHERLKNARVTDPVEKESGQVQVIFRIGKNNTGQPDNFELPERRPANRSTVARSISEMKNITAKRRAGTTELQQNETTSGQNLSTRAEQTTIRDHTTPHEGDSVNTGTAGSAVETTDNQTSWATEVQVPETDETSAERDQQADTESSDDSPSSGGDTETSAEATDTTTSDPTAPGLNGRVDTASADIDGVGSDSEDESSETSTSSESTDDSEDSTPSLDSSDWTSSDSGTESSGSTDSSDSDSGSDDSSLSLDADSWSSSDSGGGGGDSSSSSDSGGGSSDSDDGPSLGGGWGGIL